jgi:hypothetical protein
VGVGWARRDGWRRKKMKTIRYLPSAENEMDVEATMGRRVAWPGRPPVTQGGSGIAVNWDFMDTDNMLGRERIHVRMADGSIRKVCLNFENVHLADD